MQKFYVAAGHNVIRAFSKANIGFPITKKELLDRAGTAAIQVDFNKSITLADYCKNIKLDKFENKAQFFNALIGSNFSL
jgi:hypothetical protein